MNLTAVPKILVYREHKLPPYPTINVTVVRSGWDLTTHIPLKDKLGLFFWLRKTRDFSYLLVIKELMPILTQPKLALFFQKRSICRERSMLVESFLFEPVNKLTG
jgi:hypothetical protein